MKICLSSCLFAPALVVLTPYNATGDHERLICSLRLFSALPWPWVNLRPSSEHGRGYVLQLLAEIFILVIIIPTLFPKMCGAAGNFSILLRPVCILSETVHSPVSMTYLRPGSLRIRHPLQALPAVGSWLTWMLLQGRLRPWRTARVPFWPWGDWQTCSVTVWRSGTEGDRRRVMAASETGKIRALEKLQVFCVG